MKSRFKSIIIPLLLIAFSINCDQKPAQTEVVETTVFENPPQWSREVVWYQIFVERFRNGDPSNDPTKEDIKGTYPGFVPEDWKDHSLDQGLVQR